MQPVEVLMPTKRRLLLFFIVLAVMLLIKRAVGQTGSVGWNAQAVCANPEDDVRYAMLWSLCGGVLFGGLRAIMRSNDARHGRYFTGDLTLLNL